jgi:hypothetical protein
MDQIKSMSVSKLRSKEEAAVTHKKKQAMKKEPEALSMKDELMSRLKRRAGVFSGKSDKTARKRDSIIIQKSAEGGGGGGDDGDGGGGGAPPTRSLPSLFGSVAEGPDSENEDDDATVSSDGSNGSDASDLSAEDPMANRVTVPKASSTKKAGKVAKRPRRIPHTHSLTHKRIHTHSACL